MSDALALLVTAAVLLTGALTQGFFGFGFGIIAMSGLSFTHDLVHAAGVVNIVGLMQTLWLATHLRSRVMWHLCARIIPFILIGVGIGVTALDRLDRQFMVTALGVSVLAISLWNIASPRLRQIDSPILDGVAGLTGGMLGGAFNTGGPPLILHVYRRPDPPEALKATIQILFLSIGSLRLPIAASQGQLDGAVWLEALVAIPLGIGGVIAGAALAHRTDPERLRRACWSALALLGVALIVISR